MEREMRKTLSAMRFLEGWGTAARNIEALKQSGLDDGAILEVLQLESDVVGHYSWDDAKAKGLRAGYACAV